MQPDDADEPAEDQSEDSEQPPRVPRHSELPPPPKIEFKRPRLAANAPHPEQAPVGIDPASAGKMGAALSIGITFAVTILVGFWFGQLVDRHWPHVAPWGTLVLGLAGIVAGFLNLYRLAMALSRPDRPD